jgi:SAM-dependent methyltransferase
MQTADEYAFDLNDRDSPFFKGGKTEGRSTTHWLIPLMTRKSSIRRDSASTISHPAAPSKTLIKFVEEMGQAPELPVLDAGCGFGRNALALAARGASIICVDRRLDRLEVLASVGSKYLANQTQFNGAIGKLLPVLADLDPLNWPFSEKCFSGIICVHFVDLGLLQAFRASLILGGFFYFETFGGHGGNYLDLPRAGQVHDLLSKDFDLNFYRERKVGPVECDAVAVELFAYKRQ